MSLQQRISKKLIALILVCFFIGSITFTAADTIVIEVGGGGPENLKFVPQNVTAKKGDTIQWKFMGGNHNVVESMGEGSCEMKDPGSFGSLTNPPTGMYTLDIQNEKDIITFMCSVGEGSHCSAGMWGIIYVGGTEPPTFVKPTPSNNASNDNTNNANAPNNEKINTAKRCRSKQRTVPTAEGIKQVVDNTDQATKKAHEAKLENV
ncbi:extracellular serine-rich protein [Rhizophagus clarus]|uniref:Extracellular serine-rich protein n=1 Tax=Rhizophagus clarus TaxID=94130 RepID=A0A8H3QHR3_9GLOM|nr:extracellular serine-rich protein [Rhizophagus clarus]